MGYTEIKKNLEDNEYCSCIPKQQIDKVIVKALKSLVC